MKAYKKTIKKIKKIADIIIEILEYIKQGLTENDAIKIVAVKHNTSFAEINNIWKKRK